MDTYQLLDFVAIASTELLREIVGSTAKRWNAYRYYARCELARRGA